MKKLQRLLLPLLLGAFVLQVAEGETVTSHSGLRMKQSGPAISAQNAVTDAVFQAMKKEFAAGKKVEIKFMSGRPFLEHESGTIQTEQSYKDRGWILMISDKGVFNNREEILFAPHFINGYNQIHDAVIEVKVTGQEEEEEGEGEEGTAAADPVITAEGEEDEGEEVGNRTPVVKNVTAAQVEGTKLLRVNYDLEVSDGRPCTVTIRWSTNNGETFDTTAAAIVGDVGPGVEPGEKLEAIWDMGEDWNNKYTEEGRVEVIANRIIGFEEEHHVVIEHHTGIWELTDNEDFLNEKPPTEWRFVVIADSPGAESTMPAEDRKALEAAIETGSIRFVDVFYKDKDGVEHAFWFDGQHPSIAYRWYGINADLFSVSATHGSPIEDSTDLLTLDAIDHLGEGERPKIRVGGIPSHVSVLQDPEGEGSLRMEIFIESGEHEE